MRVIVRRPHAYAYRHAHKGAPIPGLVVEDASGKVRGTLALPATSQRIVAFLRGMEEARLEAKKKAGRSAKAPGKKRFY